MNAKSISEIFCFSEIFSTSRDSCMGREVTALQQLLDISNICVFAVELREFFHAVATASSMLRNVGTL